MLSASTYVVLGLPALVLGHVLRKRPVTIIELQQIADEREAWAKEARAKDLHGSAKEWELTAALARELIRCREQFGAIPDKSKGMTSMPIDQPPTIPAGCYEFRVGEQNYFSLVNPEVVVYPDGSRRSGSRFEFVGPGKVKICYWYGDGLDASKGADGIGADAKSPEERK
jgi:hypothetical protein